MKKQNKILRLMIRTSLPLIAAGFLFAGCNEKDNVDPLSVSLSSTAEKATVTALSPSDSCIAYIDELTIEGTNFSANPADNLVIFQGLKENDTAHVISATPTRLVVKVPGVKDDSVRQTFKILVAAKNANNWSPAVSYKLLNPIVNIFKYKAEINSFYGITMDKNGNVYYQMTVAGQNEGIFKLGTDGTISKFAPSSTGQGTVQYPSLKMGPNNELYATRNLKGIWKITENTPISNTPWVGGSASGIGNVSDIDFDQNGNVWAAGLSNTSVYRIKQDKTLKAFPFTGSILSVRVFEGYLYLAGTVNGKQSVWRMQIIDADNLGPAEEYVNISDKFSSKILGMTFASDGTMYLGTDGKEFMLIVDQSKNVAEYLPNLVNKGIVGASGLNFSFNSFFFGKGDELYVTTTTADKTKEVRMFKIHTKKASAPYYGLNL